MSSDKKAAADPPPLKSAKSESPEKPPLSDQTTKKQKVAPETHVYAKPPTPVSFFVTNPQTSADAFLDNPGFAAGAEESGESSGEEEKQPPFSLFGNTGAGLSSWSFGSKGEVKPKLEPLKVTNTSLFVPLPSSGSASLFGNTSKEPSSVATQPPSSKDGPQSKNELKDDHKPAKPSA